MAFAIAQARETLLHVQGPRIVDLRGYVVGFQVGYEFVTVLDAKDVLVVNADAVGPDVGRGDLRSGELMGVVGSVAPARFGPTG